jgi:hypothetical protein
MGYLFKFKIMLLLSIFMISSTSCNQDDLAGKGGTVAIPSDGTDGAMGPTSLAFTKASELPTCTPEREAQLAFIEEGSLFYVCRSTNWTKISVSTPGNTVTSPTLVKVSPLSLGSKECAGGGTLVQAGMDKNLNGVLGDDEVTSTSAVCSGRDGSAGKDGAAGKEGATGKDGAAGKDGANFGGVASTWWYTTDDPLAAVDLASESSNIFLGLTDVRVTEYKDGSVGVFVSGLLFDETLYEEDLYADSFSNYEVLKDLSVSSLGRSKAISFSVSRRANERIYYYVLLEGPIGGTTKVTFRATVDSNQNVSNNPASINFPMFKLD